MAIDQDSRTQRRPARASAPAATKAQRLRNHFDKSYHLLTDRPLSLYAAAFMRIGFGLLYLVLMVREFPHRQLIWGPESPWTTAQAIDMFDDVGWFGFLTLSNSQGYFEAFYAGSLLVAVLLIVGWHTRAMSILFAIVVISFYGRNVLITDGGDNLMLLMAIYLCFTACGRRWSVDARLARRRRALPGVLGQADLVRQTTVTVLHNLALLIIMAQMCILYGAASLYKVQGNLWGDGTAMHYVLNLEMTRPWPELSNFVDNHQFGLVVVSYLTVLVQVAFPFTLFSKLKYVILAILTSMHLGIAVLLGLPFFSGVMIVADAVFLPDRFYQALGRFGRRVLGRGRRGLAGRRPVRAAATPSPRESRGETVDANLAADHRLD